MQFENIINTIQLGNSYDLIKQIPDNSIDLVIIDPPYEYTTGGKGKNQTGEYNTDVYKQVNGDSVFILSLLINI